MLKMLSALRLTDLPRYPVIAGFASLAIAISVAWWTKIDVSPLFVSPEIRRGELWRLVTSIFPHINIFHLAFNIYWLLVFGLHVEKSFGHIRTAELLVLFALGSSSLEFAFMEGGVGLSGVVYGLFGMLWVLERRDDRFRGVIDSNTALTFVAWFAFCIVTTKTKVFVVGNVAHGAGLILGILTGIAITIPKRRALAKASIIVVILFGFLGATFLRPGLNLAGNGGYEEARWGMMLSKLTTTRWPLGGYSTRCFIDLKMQ